MLFVQPSDPDTRLSAHVASGDGGDAGGPSGAIIHNLDAKKLCYRIRSKKNDEQ